MTLGGDMSRSERLRQKRAARKEELREYDEGLRETKPWLFPLLLGIAVVVVVGVSVFWIVTGG